MENEGKTIANKKKHTKIISFAFRVSVLFLFSLCFQGWPGLAWVCMRVFISAGFFPLLIGCLIGWFTCFVARRDAEGQSTRQWPVISPSQELPRRYHM